MRQGKIERKYEENIMNLTEATVEQLCWKIEL